MSLHINAIVTNGSSILVTADLKDSIPEDIDQLHPPPESCDPLDVAIPFFLLLYIKYPSRVFVD